MNDQTRTVIARAALDVARRVRDGAFSGVIISGASNELSHELLKLGWATAFPGTELPPVYLLPDVANRLLYKRPPHPPDEGDEEHEFTWWLHANMPELEQRKGERFCVVDDFALSGHKAAELPLALERQGFTRPEFAAFIAPAGMTVEGELFIGARDDEAVFELRRLAQHIKGEPDVHEILADIRTEAERLHQEALDELSEIARRMR